MHIYIYTPVDIYIYIYMYVYIPGPSKGCQMDGSWGAILLQSLRVFPHDLGPRVLVFCGRIKYVILCQEFGAFTGIQKS